MRKLRRLAAAIGLATATWGCADRLPDYTPPESVTYLPSQNWTAEQRAWFWHTSQGTRLMPYAWFLALEQPQPSWPGAAPRFASPAYLARFGFIPSPARRDGLPIGFARDEFGVREGSDRTETVIGLTCAACHTGQIEVGRRAILIEGGPAMADVGAFQERLGVALFMTQESSPRFARFATEVFRITGEADTNEAREELRRRLQRAIEIGQVERDLAETRRLYPVNEGNGRLDALGRGGNFVFGTLAGNPANLAVADAPVSYPALWDAPWFEWVQYNAAIRQPMGRNVAEALGVRSLVKLSGPPEQLHRSSVRIQNIYDMERLLAGASPGAGLRAPQWPEEILGPIDRAAAARGEAQFRQLCSGCHAAWNPAAPGGSIPRITMVPLDRIGTDPKAAMNFAERSATLPNGERVSAAEGLRRVTTNVIEAWYDANNVPERGSWADGAGVVRPGRLEMSGNRPNEWRAPAAYRARPLNGIWATAPYLHNGSVPSLYQLLLPAERRDAAFHVGSRQFDPVQVGFSTQPFTGSFRFDTALPGNSNRGHEFRNGPRGNGVIGPELEERQRLDIIEYLKTL
jgi:mono/diheme cytochrome c family protein